jgi:hypothetical protein
MLIFLRQYRRVYSNPLLSALLLVPLTCFSAYGQGASGDTIQSPSSVPTTGAQPRGCGRLFVRFLLLVQQGRAWLR